jgi:hypothetical protein
VSPESGHDAPISKLVDLGKPDTDIDNAITLKSVREGRRSAAGFGDIILIFRKPLRSRCSLSYAEMPSGRHMRNDPCRS